MAPAAEMSQAAAPNPKLVRAAHEFEAQMMKELLKPLTASDGLTGEDGSGSDLGSDMDSDGGLDLGSGSGSGGALADFASEALGQALSERGGFGVADKIVRELSHAHRGGETGVGAGIGVRRVTGKVTIPPHGNTVMRTDQ
jgi:Rod binding domain-containing protein